MAISKFTYLLSIRGDREIEGGDGAENTVKKVTIFTLETKHSAMATGSALHFSRS